MGMEIGPLHVRRSAFLGAGCERVWREFGSFERLAAWFGQGHRLETYQPELGGSVLLSIEMDGQPRRFGGEVVVFEPGRELSFSNNWEVDGWPVPTFITLRLSALYEGCLIELYHHGFERLGAAAAEELAGYEAGWHSRHLEALRMIVEDSPAADRARG